MEFPTIDGYKIIKRIGRGGMANVFLAVQQTFERNVALKVMSPHLLADESFSQRFLREARTVAKLSHQNIIPVYDVGRCGDFHYISMEYLPAGDLKSRMQKGLDLDAGLQIVKQLANGLHYAASKSCVHRDIKPDNILFREDLSPVICDFGIARNNETTQMTVIGTVIGTPHYMSPEQALSKPIDGRSDLYSLGVILFEMLTGEVPYSGDSAVSIGISHSTKEIPRLPQEKVLFQPFVDRALAKSPDHRFQTGQEFIQALEQVEYNWLSQNSNDDESTVFMGSPRFHTQPPAVNMDLPEDVTVPRARQNAQYNTTGTEQHTSPNLYTNNYVAAEAVGETRSLATGPNAKPQSQWLESMQQFLLTAGWIKLGGIAAALVVGILALGWITGESTDNIAVDFAARDNLDDKIRLLNQQAERALEQGDLFTPAEQSAHYYLTTLLALAPNDVQGKQNIHGLFSRYLEKSQTAIATGFFEDGDEWLSHANQITYYIDQKKLLKQYKSLQVELLGWKKQQLLSREKQLQINQLLTKAEELLNANQLTTPATGNAYDTFREVLSIDQGNQAALDGVDRIAQQFLTQANSMIEENNFTRARAYIAAAQQIAPEHSQLAITQGLLDQQHTIFKEQRQSNAQSELLKQSLADARIRQESLKRAETIDQLLTDAGYYLEQAQLTKPANANALTSYQSVLALDPSNATALEGVASVLKQMVANVDKAIEQSQLQQAAGMLVEVKQLDSDDLYYAATESRLLASLRKEEARLAVQAERQRKLSELTGQAKQLVADNKIYAPEKMNALNSLRQALDIDSNYSDALSLRSELLAQVEDNTLELIKNKTFDQADVLLEVLKNNEHPAKKVSNLSRKLNNARNNLENSIKSDEIIASISPSDANKVTYRNYSKLADAYTRALKLDSENDTAKVGLKKVNTYLTRQFNRTVKEYDFGQASQYLSVYKKSNGNSRQTRQLQEQLDNAKNTRQNVITLLDEADKIIDVPFKKPGLFGSNKANLKQLRDARAKVEQAQSLDPRNPVLKITLDRLEKKYARIIQLYIDKNKKKEALKFLEDAKLIKSSHSYLQPFEAELGL